MNPDRAKQPFEVGYRVFHKRMRLRGGSEIGGWRGTIVRIPDGAEGVPPDLLGILADDGELCAVHPTLLVATGEADGFAISRQKLIEKRKVLFAHMVRVVATARRVDLADAHAMQQVEADVATMSKSWGDADGTRLRRRGFRDNAELRRLLGKYLSLGDLIEELGAPVGEESS